MTEPIIIQKELIQDGTGVNYRTIKQIYVGEEGVKSETFTYRFPANSGEWAAVESIVVEDYEVADAPIFREWTISDHPTTGDARKVGIVNLTVTTDEIKALFKVIHIESEIPDRLILKIGDNTVRFPWGEDDTIGERDYWDFLTEQLGLTPYELLDQRVPQLDMEGGFNG
jgi:hypothetical protein